MEAATCASNIMDMDEIENHRPIILHRKLGLLKESKSGDCYHRHGVVCDSHRQIPEPVATGPTLYQPIAMQNFEPVPQLQQACLSIPYGAINTSQQGEVVLLKQQQYCDKFNNYRYSTAHEVVDGSSEVQHLVTVTEQPSLFSVAPLRAACTSVCDGGKESVMNESLTTITWLGHMDAQKLVPCTSNLPLRHRQLERGRPPYSYMALIQFAINSSPSRRMTLRQIYNWIQERFPYFKHAKPGWKNSIRHNLSLHDIFVREVSSSSKASYWTIQADLNERPLTLDCVTKMPFSHLAHLNEDTEINQNQDRQHGTLMPTDSSTYETSAKTSSLITSQLSPIQPEQTNGNVHFVPSLSSFLVYDKNSAPTPKRLVFSEIQNETQVKKKRRKQPLKTMNDSLNDSLHFNDTLSKSPSDSSPSLDVVYPSHGKAGDISDESGLGASFCMGRLQATPSCQAIMSESHGTSTIKPNRISESMPSTSDADTGLEDCLPQIFDGDTFAFNSSFSRFLNANATSLFNNSAFSTCDFSDIDDASFIQQSKP